MRNLMKFGMVLVVLAMVTSVAFAKETYIGPTGDPLDSSWCTEANWDNNVPDGDDALIDNGETVVIDCGPVIDTDELAIVDGGVIVGTATYQVELNIGEDLEMSDEDKTDVSSLNIVNGIVNVHDKSEKLGQEGNCTIDIAAGSQLNFRRALIFGNDNDGTNSTYEVNIAGKFTVNKDRFEHKGGHLTINLSGEGKLFVKETSRLSSDDDSQTTINIIDDAVCHLDKVELGEKDDGIHDDYDYSLAINISGNGTWDGSGEEMKDQRDGQIVNINITGNGSFITKDLDIDNSDSVLNINISGDGSFEIEDDVDMQGGHISVTENGSFYVNDTFELGDGDDASMTIATTGDVWLGELVLDDGTLTITGCHVEAKRLDDMDGDCSIEINGAGSFALDKVEDGFDMDDLNDAIDDGDIFTSNPGMVIVMDKNITKDGFTTLQPAIIVDVDIKPGTDTNPLRVNFQGSGVFPVAIVGSDDVDAADIDVDSITLAGVAAVRGKLGDINQDGTPDLVLKFNRADILEAIEDAHGDLGDLQNRDELTLTLFGKIGDTVISGSDTLQVLNRGGVKRKKQ